MHGHPEPHDFSIKYSDARGFRLNTSGYSARHRAEMAPCPRGVPPRRTATRPPRPGTRSARALMMCSREIGANTKILVHALPPIVPIKLLHAHACRAEGFSWRGPPIIAPKLYIPHCRNTSQQRTSRRGAAVDSRPSNHSFRPVKGRYATTGLDFSLKPGMTLKENPFQQPEGDVIHPMKTVPPTRTTAPRPRVADPCRAGRDHYPRTFKNTSREGTTL
jgi:hypothetical protein